MQIPVLEHLACNVERGYAAQRGVGFQTVGLSEALLGTADLTALEEMAPYYELTNARRQNPPLPARESCFRLPSGRIALSRTVDWGTDPHGRAGNYLWHALVLEADAAAGDWDPFRLLDAAGAGASNTDLTPRVLPQRSLPASEPPDLAPLRGLPAGLFGQLVAGLDGAQTPLLVGPEPLARGAISGLRTLLPAPERATLTFSTHFYRGCHGLRNQFCVVASGSPTEAPNEPTAYREFDLSTASREPASTALGRYAEEALAQGRPERLSEFSRLAEAVRRGAVPPGTVLPGLAARLALWEVLGKPTAPLLASSAVLMTELLSAPQTPRALADALLEQTTPARLRAEGDGAAETALAALKAAASPGAWKAWRKRWAGDPLLAAAKAPWWRFWGAGSAVTK